MACVLCWYLLFELLVGVLGLCVLLGFCCGYFRLFGFVYFYLCVGDVVALGYVDLAI